VPRVRGLPPWMQYSLRKTLVKMMKGFKGRQVVQPSDAEGEGEKSGVSESDKGEEGMVGDEKIGDSAVLVGA
jgi:hypothetical protein